MKRSYKNNCICDKKLLFMEKTTSKKTTDYEKNDCSY
jgi:hypothetical protein